MNQKNEKKFAGVWLDNEHAIIITQDQGAGGTEFAINEKIRSEETHGGGSEHSINNARQAHSIKYFKSISSQLLNYDEIFFNRTRQSPGTVEKSLARRCTFQKQKS